MNPKTVVYALVFLALLAGAASAAQVTLPNTSNTVTFTASVSEQCNIAAIPSSVTFNVTDVTSGTNAADATVTINTIVLNDGNRVRVSLQANAANFTAPAGGTVTWAATNVSWDAAAWSSGLGNAASLTNASYTEVAASAANPATMSSSDLTFTLAAKSTVDRAGNHTLVATWKVESTL